MDQHFYACLGEGQAWKFEIEYLPGPQSHQFKQSNS